MAVPNQIPQTSSRTWLQALPKLGGAVRVEQKVHHIVLRFSTHPWFCAVWCFGIMGGLWWLFHLALPPVLSSVIAVLGGGLAAAFVALEVFTHRQPPLLTFDRASRKIAAPRHGLEFSAAADVCLMIGAFEMQESDGPRWRIALLLWEPSLPEPVPICKGAGRRFLLRTEEFATLAGLRIVTLPKLPLDPPEARR